MLVATSDWLRSCNLRLDPGSQAYVTIQCLTFQIYVYIRHSIMLDAISNTIGEWTGLINGVSHVFMI